MKTEGSRGTKRKIALAAVCVGAVLCVLTFLFIEAVKQQLWEQSVETIMESTQQGCTTLRVQLQDDIDSIRNIADYVSGYTMEQKEDIRHTVQSYAGIEGGVSLYQKAVISNQMYRRTALRQKRCGSQIRRKVLSILISAVLQA